MYFGLKMRNVIWNLIRHVSDALEKKSYQNFGEACTELPEERDLLVVRFFSPRIFRAPLLGSEQKCHRIPHRVLVSARNFLGIKM